MTPPTRFLRMRQNERVSKLELARPALRALVCAVTFDSSPLFPDVRGAITQDLLGILDTKMWRFEGRELIVVNEESKRQVALEPDSMFFIVEEPPADPEALCAEFVDMANLALARIQVSHLSLLALNLDWRIGVQRGDKLPAWIHEFFGLNAANKFFDAFGGRPTETETKFVFTPQENVLVAAEVKPLEAEDAAEESFFEADASDFPHESLQLDLWRAEEVEEQFPLGELGERWMDSYSRLLKISERAGLAMVEPS